MSTLLNIDFLMINYFLSMSIIISRSDSFSFLRALTFNCKCSLSLSDLQEKEMEKQRLLYQQSRLHNRGAAEMVLQMISACKGSSAHFL